MRRIFTILCIYSQWKTVTLQLPPETDLQTDDFKCLSLHRNFLVDKTLFIQEFLNSTRNLILINRPKGWGKSLNLNMLQRFFQIETDYKGDRLPKTDTVNDKLFIGGQIKIDPNKTVYVESKQISEIPHVIKHYMGKWPVISLKLKNATGDSYEKILEKVKSCVTEAFKEHAYLFRSTKVTLLQELEKYFTGKFGETDLQHSLYFLSWKLFEHFGEKVLILIDDYDVPVVSAYLEFGNKQEEFESVLKLLKHLYEAALVHNNHFRRGLLTGTTKISLTNDMSMGLNHIEVCTLYQKQFSTCYGFSHFEVLKLHGGVQTVGVHDLLKWCAGYRFEFNNDIFYLYNPRSTMRFLTRNGTLNYNEVDSNITSNITSLINRIILEDEIQKQMRHLTSGEGVAFSTFSYKLPIRWNRIAVYELLLLSGYLTLKQFSSDQNIVSPLRLAIPNEEMKHIFFEKTLQWVIRKINVSHSEFHSFARLLSFGELKKFKEILEKYLLRAAKFLKSQKNNCEAFYFNFFIALQKTLLTNYTINGTQKINTDREVLLIPKLNESDTAIAINYKVVEMNMKTMVLGCIAELRSGLYSNKLESQFHVQKLIKVGLACCDEKVSMAYEIDDLNHLRSIGRKTVQPK